MKNLLTAFSLLIFSWTAYATNDTFKLGYSEFKPFIWQENGIHKGIYVDILKEAMEKRMGLKLVFQQAPYKRVERFVESGAMDGLIQRSTSERLEYTKASRVPVAIGMVGVFTYRENPQMTALVNTKSLEDLKKYTILTSLGDQWATENLQGFKVDKTAKSLKALLRQLAAKRGDIVLEIEQVGQFNINQYQLSDQLVQIPNIALNPILYTIYISLKSPFANITTELDKILTAMLNDGTTDAIYKRYRSKETNLKELTHQLPKINFIHYGLTDALDKISAEVNSQQNKFRLTPLYLDMDSYKQAVKVMLAGGKPSEIIMTWSGYRTQHLVDAGFIEPIDDIWASEQLNKRFSAATAAGMTYNNKKYAIPLTHHVVPIIYNKKIFHENNLSVPKTWQAFLVLCQNLKNKGITPIALGSREIWTAQFWFDYILVQTAGIRYRQRLMVGEASYNDPQVRHVFYLWKELIERDFFITNNRKYTNNEANDLLHAGKAAMVLNGTWAFGYFEKNLNWIPVTDFDIFQFPQIEDHIKPATVGVMDVAVQTRGEHLEANKKVIKVLSEKNNQELFSLASGSLSPSTEVPISSYSEMLQNVSMNLSKVEREILSYDLSTPPQVAEIGLELFADFLENPEQYLELLSETDKKVKVVFAAQDD